MTLIKSISGIRGTVGGNPGDNLTPPDVVKYTAAFAKLILNGYSSASRPLVVIGRDARVSGPGIAALVSSTLTAMGVDVLDLGLSTTPTVEVAVSGEKAAGGIIITASHNPGQWNALKLLNEKGEFISAERGAALLQTAEVEDFSFAQVEALGSLRTGIDWKQKHIDLICSHPLVDTAAIAAAGFYIAVDAVNSSGGIFVPELLEALGVQRIEKLYCEPTGHFPHNPEPLPEHLSDLSALVVQKGCHLGITVDPDVDRLAFVCEDGSVFGEEYTLVAVADYYLSRKPGNTVSNLSSTRALRDITHRHGQKYHASAVGEVNVVEMMKATNAVIGGEGNGGIIDPELHYGRDALVGIGLFLTHLALSGKHMTALRDSYPAYFISKNKLTLTPGINADALLEAVAMNHRDDEVNLADGVKIDFPDGWVHLRKSNTEPIIRIYAEANSPQRAAELAEIMMKEINLAIS